MTELQNRLYRLLYQSSENDDDLRNRRQRLDALMRIWHMSARFKRRLSWSHRPSSYDERKSVILDAFHNGGYEEAGQVNGDDRCDAIAAKFDGKRATETGDIITDGNHIWTVFTDGPDQYLGTWCDVLTH